MPYEPKPVDTSSIELPQEILELTELLAKNAHEVWAKQRIAEGWTYGAVRDDLQKKHPCLVEYEELNDADMQYDRITAIGTLKLIVAMGYKITKCQAT